MATRRAATRRGEEEAGARRARTGAGRVSAADIASDACAIVRTVARNDVTRNVTITSVRTTGEIFCLSDLH